MLASKLISIAAAIALAVPSTIALEQATHLRVQIHHHQKGPCHGPNQSPMSVEGVEGVYCVTGQPCVANIHGNCPGPQPGLEFGSSCGTVASGVQGCKVNKSAPKPEEEEEEPVEEEGEWEDVSLCTGENESPMSVQGVEKIFCVSGQACVAHHKNGACPGPQEGLEWGSSCNKIETGVYGCTPNNGEEAEEPVEEEGAWEEEDANVCTGEDESPMSVQGVEQIFCVSGQACVAHHKHGACPGPQEGLEWGSSCNEIETGVYGCTPNNSEEEPVEEGEEREGEEDDEGDVEIEIEIETDNSCWSDETPISVQGLKQIFCVSGQVCVDDFKDGACPGPQEGLEWGSSCAKIETGVYGCVPNEKGEEEEEASNEEETTVVIDTIDDMEGGDEEASSEEDAAKKEGEEEDGENAGEEEEGSVAGDAGRDAGEEEEGSIAGDAGNYAGEEEEGSVAGDAGENAGDKEGSVAGDAGENAGEEGEATQGEEQTEGENEETEEDEEVAPARHHHHLRHKKVHHKKHHVKASEEDSADESEDKESADEDSQEEESQEEDDNEEERHHHHKKH